MAGGNKVQVFAEAGKTLDFLVRNGSGMVWNTSGGTGAFETYQTANYASYVTSMVEQGSASAYYAGTFPAAIGPGLYSVVSKVRANPVSPAESDRYVGGGDVHWDGSQFVSLADMVTSGQFALAAPMRPARGVMIPNFLFKMVGATDHVSPHVSGAASMSGQISRDGASFVRLQSGAFSEVGLGWYSVTLTSGDLLANTAAGGLTCRGADQRDFSFVLQRTSGQN